MSTYIVIEVTEKENALDIMNVLMTHTKSRFIVTKDIGEYARERELLMVNAEKSIVNEPIPPPAKQRRAEGDGENQSSSQEWNFSDVVPKQETVKLANANSSMQHQFQQNFHGLPNNLELSQDSTSFDTSSTQLRQNGKRLSPLLSHSLQRRTGPTPYQCALCGSVIRANGLDYYKRSNHAIVHTNFMRHICPIPGCGMKARHRSNVVQHLKQMHPECGKMSIMNCMKPAEEEELKHLTYKCFPELEGIEVQKRGRKPLRFEEEDGTSVGDAEEVGRETGEGSDNDGMDEMVEEVTEDY